MSPPFSLFLSMLSPGNRCHLPLHRFMPHQKGKSAAFAPFPVTTPSRVETKTDSASSLKATACQRVITTRRIRLFRSVKRRCDVCWHLLAQYSIFTSSVTITAWAWGYCHAVAMTSGIHKKIPGVFSAKGGRPVDSNTHTQAHPLKDAQSKTQTRAHILST